VHASVSPGEGLFDTSHGGDLGQDLAPGNIAEKNSPGDGSLIGRPGSGIQAAHEARVARTWTENRRYQQSSWRLQASTTGKSDRHFTEIPIRRPDEDHPSQTLGPYLPDGTLPTTLLPDSEDKDPKYYKLILVENGKAAGDI
jgi:hypothetical protein